MKVKKTLDIVLTYEELYIIIEEHIKKELGEVVTITDFEIKMVDDKHSVIFKSE